MGEPRGKFMKIKVFQYNEEQDARGCQAFSPGAWAELGELSLMFCFLLFIFLFLFDCGFIEHYLDCIWI